MSETPRTDDLAFIKCDMCGSEYASSNELAINVQMVKLKRDLAAALERSKLAEADYEACKKVDHAFVEAMKITLKNAEAERDLWKNAVIDGCVVRHIYTKEHDTDPRKALNDCAVWDQQAAIDPAISEDAQRLRDTYKAERDAAVGDAERYRWLRANPCLPFGVTRYGLNPVEYYSGDSLDAAIDAAMEGK